MRLAILSDIHGNYEALKSVLADIDAAQIDETVCLGDCIGYGPQPEEVLTAIRDRNIATIIGNHEMAVVDPVHLDWFNPLARRSLKKTLALLSPQSIAFIQELPYHMMAGDCLCVHGFPPDSAQTYLFQKSTHDLKNAFDAMEQRICFLGHTHDLEIVTYDGQDAKRRALKQGITALEKANKYIVNVGSVGQPRDGTNPAKYVILDTYQYQIEVKFIPYDIEKTVAGIKAARLPEVHARRLL